MRRWTLLAMAAAGVALGLGVSHAAACGGFFCQSSPVDQVGERIVFTINDDDTVTSLVEILYRGEADDFSWILPIPEAIDVDALQVPDDGQEVFTELHTLTDVQIIAPPMPECAQLALESVRFASTSGREDEFDAVTVFASGEVGPFGFDVIGAEDPAALTGWLRDNGYLVEPSMEPLIDLYVDEKFAFVAMRLLDGEDADSITPIEITYPGSQAMIPLRLTAVAAQPDMPIFTWVFADTQVVPENFAHMEIATAELTFSAFGQNDYRLLVRDRADANDGRAFITEYAGDASTFDFAHDYLAARSDRYLTRLFTVISPEEMTLDPMFVEQERPDISNVRDASQLVGLFDCARVAGNETDALDPFGGSNRMLAAPLVSDQPILVVVDEEAATNTGEFPSATAITAPPTPLASDDTPVIWVVAGVFAALALGVGFSLRTGGARSD